VGAIVLVAIIAIVITAPPRSTGLPLDPASADSDGTKALVLTLEGLGADVEVLDTVPDDDVDTLLVMVDNLSGAAGRQARALARAGATLVITDSGGSIQPELREEGIGTVGFFSSSPLDQDCGLAAFRDVERIRVGTSSAFSVPNGATGCFMQDGVAWMVVQPEGQGTIVTTGGASFLTNALIGADDNAVLAAALLAPDPGTRVAVVRPDFAVARGARDRRSLSDMIPSQVKWGLAQLLFAFVLMALWRGRRVGRPVREMQPVRLAASELVVAVGQLYQRTGAIRRAAELLRADLRRGLSRRLGVPETLEPEAFAEAAAARAATDVNELRELLGGPLPASPAELVTMAQRAAHVRDAVATTASTGVRRVND
jgi:hypothetical protein